MSGMGGGRCLAPVRVVRLFWLRVKKGERAPRKDASSKQLTLGVGVSAPKKCHIFSPYTSNCLFISSGKSGPRWTIHPTCEGGSQIRAPRAAVPSPSSGQGEL